MSTRSKKTSSNCFFSHFMRARRPLSNSAALLIAAASVLSCVSAFAETKTFVGKNVIISSEISDSAGNLIIIAGTADGNTAAKSVKFSAAATLDDSGSILNTEAIIVDTGISVSVGTETVTNILNVENLKSIKIDTGGKFYTGGDLAFDNLNLKSATLEAGGNLNINNVANASGTIKGQKIEIANLSDDVNAGAGLVIEASAAGTHENRNLKFTGNVSIGNSSSKISAGQFNITSGTTTISAGRHTTTKIFYVSKGATFKMTGGTFNCLISDNLLPGFGASGNVTIGGNAQFTAERETRMHVLDLQGSAQFNSPIVKISGVGETSTISGGTLTASDTLAIYNDATVVVDGGKIEAENTSVGGAITVGTLSLKNTTSDLGSVCLYSDSTLTLGAGTVLTANISNIYSGATLAIAGGNADLENGIVDPVVVNGKIILRGKNKFELSGALQLGDNAEGTSSLNLSACTGTIEVNALDLGFSGNTAKFATGTTTINVLKLADGAKLTADKLEVKEIQNANMTGALAINELSVGKLVDFENAVVSKDWASTTAETALESLRIFGNGFDASQKAITINTKKLVLDNSGKITQIGNEALKDNIVEENLKAVELKTDTDLTTYVGADLNLDSITIGESASWKIETSNSVNVGAVELADNAYLGTTGRLEVSALSAGTNSVLSVKGELYFGGGEGTIAGTLNGDLTLNNAAQAEVSGTIAGTTNILSGAKLSQTAGTLGDVVVSGDGSLFESDGGEVKNLAVSDGARGKISGANIDKASVSDSGQLGMLGGKIARVDVGLGGEFWQKNGKIDLAYVDKGEFNQFGEDAVVERLGFLTAAIGVIRGKVKFLALEGNSGVFLRESSDVKRVQVLGANLELEGKNNSKITLLDGRISGYNYEIAGTLTDASGTISGENVVLSGGITDAVGGLQIAATETLKLAGTVNLAQINSTIQAPKIIVGGNDKASKVKLAGTQIAGTTHVQSSADAQTTFVLSDGATLRGDLSLKENSQYVRVSIVDSEVIGSVDFSNADVTDLLTLENATITKNLSLGAGTVMIVGTNSAGWIDFGSAAITQTGTLTSTGLLFTEEYTIKTGATLKLATSLKGFGENAKMTLEAGATLNGNLILENSQQNSTFAGTLNGDLTLNNAAQAEVSGTIAGTTNILSGAKLSQTAGTLGDVVVSGNGSVFILNGGKVKNLVVSDSAKGKILAGNIDRASVFDSGQLGMLGGEIARVDVGLGGEFRQEGGEISIVDVGLGGRFYQKGGEIGEVYVDRGIFRQYGEDALAQQLLFSTLATGEIHGRVYGLALEGNSNVSLSETSDVNHVRVLGAYLSLEGKNNSEIDLLDGRILGRDYEIAGTLTNASGTISGDSVDLTGTVTDNSSSSGTINNGAGLKINAKSKITLAGTVDLTQINSTIQAPKIIVGGNDKASEVKLAGTQIAGITHVQSSANAQTTFVLSNGATLRGDLYLDEGATNAEISIRNSQVIGSVDFSNADVTDLLTLENATITENLLLGAGTVMIAGTNSAGWVDFGNAAITQTGTLTSTGLLFTEEYTIKTGATLKLATALKGSGENAKMTLEEGATLNGNLILENSQQNSTLAGTLNGDLTLDNSVAGISGTIAGTTNILSGAKLSQTAGTLGDVVVSGNGSVFILNGGKVKNLALSDSAIGTILDANIDKASVSDSGQLGMLGGKIARVDVGLGGVFWQKNGRVDMAYVDKGEFSQNGEDAVVERLVFSTAATGVIRGKVEYLALEGNSGVYLRKSSNVNHVQVWGANLLLEGKNNSEITLLDGRISGDNYEIAGTLTKASGTITGGFVDLTGTVMDHGRFPGSINNGTGLKIDAKREMTLAGTVDLTQINSTIQAPKIIVGGNDKASKVKLSGTTVAGTTHVQSSVDAQTTFALSDGATLRGDLYLDEGATNAEISIRNSQVIGSVILTGTDASNNLILRNATITENLSLGAGKLTVVGTNTAGWIDFGSATIEQAGTLTSTGLLFTEEYTIKTGATLGVATSLKGSGENAKMTLEEGATLNGNLILENSQQNSTLAGTLNGDLTLDNAVAEISGSVAGAIALKNCAELTQTAGTLGDIALDSGAAFWQSKNTVAGTLTLRAEEDQERRTYAWIDGNVKSVDLLGYTRAEISETAQVDLLTLSDGAQARVCTSDGVEKIVVNEGTKLGVATDKIYSEIELNGGRIELWEDLDVSEISGATGEICSAFRNAEFTLTLNEFSTGEEGFAIRLPNCNLVFNKTAEFVNSDIAAKTICVKSGARLLLGANANLSIGEKLLVEAGAYLEVSENFSAENLEVADDGRAAIKITPEKEFSHAKIDGYLYLEIENFGIVRDVAGRGTIKKFGNGEVQFGEMENFSGYFAIAGGNALLTAEKTFGGDIAMVHAGTLSVDYGAKVAGEVILVAGSKMEIGAGENNNFASVATVGGVTAGRIMMRATNDVPDELPTYVVHDIYENDGEITADKLILTNPEADLRELTALVRSNIIDESSIGNRVVKIDLLEGDIEFGYGALETEGFYYTNFWLENDGRTLAAAFNWRSASAYGANLFNANQTAVSQALAAGTPTGRLAEYLGAGGLAGTHSVEETARALDSLGALHTVSMMPAQIDATWNIQASIRNAIGKGVRLSDSGERFGAWAQYISSTTDVDGNAKRLDWKRSTNGAAAGFEYDVAENLLVGLAIVGEDSKLKSNGNEIESATYRAGAYFRHERDGFKQNAVISLGVHDYDISRYVRVGSLADKCDGSIDGFSLAANYEASYNFAVKEWLTLAPVAQIGIAFNSIDAWTESGAGTASLRYGSQSATTVLAGIGGRVACEIPNPFGEHGRIRLTTEAIFTAEFGENSCDLDAEFTGTGTRFSMNYDEPKPYALNLGANISVPVTKKISMFGGISTEIREDENNFNANVGASIVW